MLQREGGGALEAEQGDLTQPELWGLGCGVWGRPGLPAAPALESRGRFRQSHCPHRQDRMEHLTPLPSWP